MAEIADAPPDLRGLARRIPPETLQRLSPLELELRCEEASALLGEADGAGEGHQADRLRRDARRVLNAMTPAGYELAVQILSDQIREAQLKGADREALALRQELHAITQANPQPDPARLLARAKAEVGKLSIPGAPPQSAMSRRFGKRRRAR